VVVQNIIVLGKKALTNTTIRGDLSKFCHKVIIRNAGDKIWSSDSSLSEEDNLVELVTCLGQILNDDPQSITRLIHTFSQNTCSPQFSVSPPIESELPELSYIVTPKVDIGVESINLSHPKTWAVLKCLSSENLFLPLMKMRNQFYNIIPFSDVRGSWNIQVKITPGEPVVVVHRRQEKSSEENGWTLEWILMMTLAETFNKLDRVDFRITSYSFEKSASPETISQVKRLTKPFYRPMTLRDFPINLDVQTLLSTAVERLKLEDPKILVHHRDLPFTVELVELLNQALHNLNTGEEKISHTSSPSRKPFKKSLTDGDSKIRRNSQSYQFPEINKC